MEASSTTRRRRRRLLIDVTSKNKNKNQITDPSGPDAQMSMTNGCIAGCAHGGAYTWPGLGVGLMHPGLVHPGLMHPGLMHPAFGMYGPPVPHSVLLEKQEKREKQETMKQQQQQQQQHQQRKSTATQSATQPTALHHAALIGATGIYAATAPVTSCVMQCMGMGLAAMKEANGNNGNSTFKMFKVEISVFWIQPSLIIVLIIVVVIFLT